MNLNEAVRTLGGAAATARRSGVARTVIMYWMKNGVSRFRKADEAKIIQLAEHLSKPKRKAKP